MEFSTLEFILITNIIFKKSLFPIPCLNTLDHWVNKRLNEFLNKFFFMQSLNSSSTSNFTFIARVTRRSIACCHHRHCTDTSLHKRKLKSFFLIFLHHVLPVNWKIFSSQLDVVCVCVRFNWSMKIDANNAQSKFNYVLLCHNSCRISTMTNIIDVIFLALHMLRVCSCEKNPHTR